MKRTQFFALFFLTAFASLFSQTASFVWAKQFTGTSSEEGRALVTDASGNVFSVGHFGGTADFDPGAGTTYLTSNANTNTYISKLNSNGTFGWVRQLGGTNNVYGQDITLDANGNIYITGNFLGTADLDPGGSTYTVASSAGCLFILKLNSSGTFVWAKQFGSPSAQAFAIKVDGGGNVYTTGNFISSGDWDPGVGVVTLISAGQEDIYINKFDASANFLWAKRMGSNYIEITTDLDIDLAGNVFTTGYFDTGFDFDPGAATYSVNPIGTTDAFVHKLDGSGNFVWVKNFGGMFNTAFATGIEVDGSNNVITIGGHVGVVDFDPGPGTYTFAPTNGTDTYISKLDNAGNMLWTKKMGSPNAGDLANSIAVNPFREIYLTGNFQGTVDFNPEPATFTIAAAGGGDIYAVKLDSMGMFRWAVGTGGTSSEDSKDIAIDPAENVHITGFFGGTTDMNPSNATYSLLASGSIDAFVLKLCQNPEQPTAVSGPSLVCSGTSASYSASAVSTATGYAWVFPASWSASGSSTLITSTTGSTSGFVQVTAQNACGNSPAQTFSVTVNLSPSITVSSGSICAGNSFTLNPNGITTVSYIPSGPVVTPVSTSTYGIYGVGANGCASTYTAVANVTVYALPTVSVNSGTICTGQTFSLMASGAASYNYQGGSSTVTPSSNSSYTVTGISSQGCPSSSAAISQVTVFSLPSISASGGSVCAGQSFVIPASGAPTFTSSVGSMTVTPLSNSVYTVTGISSEGCFSQPATVTVTVAPLPQISVNSGSICEGLTFTITPSGAFSYTFSSGTSQVSPVVTTTYSVSGSSSVGCVSSNSAVSTVIVHQAPVVTLNSGSICAGNTFTLVPSGALNYTITGGNFIVTPPATTIYTLTGSSGMGCVSLLPASGTVIVNNIPLPQITAPSGSICVGKSFTISPTGAATYTISGGSSVVSPPATTVYTILGTSSGGCISSSVVTVTVQVHSLPMVSISGGNSEICAGEPVVLTALGAVNYQWTGNLAGTTITVSPQNTTVYTVSGSDAVGCVNTASVTQIVNACTGLNPFTADGSFLDVFPNPHSGVFTIVAPSPLSVEIVNVIGQRIMAVELVKGKNKIDLNSVPSGVYFINGTNQGRTTVNFKVVKE